MRLRVIKADGSVEEYLHTKVIGTINNALGMIERADISIAEELAEVVTYFIYQDKKLRRVTSGEIFSMIKTVLAATGYEEAALALSECHFERRLKRSRVEVVSVDICELADAELFAADEHRDVRNRWDKSVIVRDLMAKYDICHQTARMVASMVEEKILNMGVSLIPGSLVRQLVLSEAAAVLKAQRQLQEV